MLRVNTDQIQFTDDYFYLLNGKPFTGIGFETNDEGAIISEMEFQKGLQHGTTRSFYPTGAIQREAQYKYNTLNGFVRVWDEAGVLENEDEFERGVCVRRKTRDSYGELRVCYELEKTNPQFSTLQLLRKSKFNPPPE